MYIVLTQRVIKVARHSTEKFGARSDNEKSWAIVGPFTKRATAERAAVSASATHTCLAAVVIGSAEDWAKFEKAYDTSNGYGSRDYSWERMAKIADHWMLEPAPSA
jgi:hypothetical protein